MSMKHGEGGDYEPGRGSQPPGLAQGFFSAPWWRLLLWIAIFLAVVVVAEALGLG